MTKNFTKYFISLLVILFGISGHLLANSPTSLPASTTANMVGTDHTGVAVQDSRVFIVKPYTPQFEKHVKIEITNIEDEDEDELNHDDKHNFGKNYIELEQFFSSLSNLAFSEQLPQAFSSRTFSPLSLKSLNIAFCIFRI